jgi:hypothetical protein
MYARSNCSVSPATAETAGSFKGIPVAFMEFAQVQVMRERVTMSAPAAIVAQAVPECVLKVKRLAELVAQRTPREPLPKASRPVEPQRVLEKRLARAKPERPEPVLAAASQLDRPALVLASQGQRSSAPSRE